MELYLTRNSYCKVILETTQTNLYFLGDIHGDWDLLGKYLNQYGISNSTIIQVGDFGMGFREPKREREILLNLNKKLLQRNVNLLAIRGNHDYPFVFKGRYSAGIELVPDYSLKTIGGLDILLMGGAISVDRTVRKVGESYWTQEGFRFSDRSLELLLAKTKKIDIVVTHSCPKEIYPYKMNEVVMRYLAVDEKLGTDLENDREDHSKLLKFLIDNNRKPTWWFYGHYHESRKTRFADINFRLLDINEYCHFVDF
jgi:Icc-related predicted phosphoesterase